MPYNPKKHNPIPADVVPNDSKALGTHGTHNYTTPHRQILVVLLVPMTLAIYTHTRGQILNLVLMVPISKPASYLSNCQIYTYLLGTLGIHVTHNYSTPHRQILFVILVPTIYTHPRGPHSPGT